MTRLTLLVIFVSLFQGFFGQENAGTSVSPSLIECYNNTVLTARENLLPRTIQTLIALIRKIEDDSPSINARELSVQLLHRFRQDGIKKDEREPTRTYGIPYSPRGYEANKNRVQLAKLTPPTPITFNNNSLNAVERCSLHSFISSSIDVHERGDEKTVCNVISRYTLRTKRDTELTERVGDSTSSHISACPIEDGVVYTKWGAVKAGLLLAGIAAGFEQMYVPAPNGNRSNNIFASTIAGELSEAALYQGADPIKIGAKGGWQNNLLPRYYYIQDNVKLQVTDAEIRGGLDGLYMGLIIDSWKSRATTLFNNIKVSQILEAYYSTRGLFNQTIRACNRKNILNYLVPQTTTLVDEVANFNYLLDERATYLYSPEKSLFRAMAESAVNSFTNYLSNLNDLECTNNEGAETQEASELVIFIDSSWNFNVIQNILSYLLTNLNVNPYGVRYTIFDGTTVNPLVNGSYDITDIYEKMNATTYQQNHPTGFDYKQVFIEIDNYFTTRLNNESATNGVSTIALLIPHKAPTDEERTNIRNKKDSFQLNLPDLKLLVLGFGSPGDYNDLVYTTNKDIFTLTNDQYTDDTTTKNLGRDLARRIQEIPRSIVNTKCGSRFSSDVSSFDVIQFVDQLGINYYRIAPHYFYSGSNDNRNLKIQGAGYGTLTVCMSRTVNNPRSSDADQACKTITSDETSYSLLGFCDGETTTSCAPIYISVEGITSSLRCNDQLCPNPASIRFQIRLENVGCSSAGKLVVQSIIFLVTLISILIYF